MFLFEWQSYTEEEKQWEESYIYWFPPQMPTWPEPNKSEARRFLQVFHKFEGAKGLGPSASQPYVGKWRFWGRNWSPYGCWHHRQRFSIQQQITLPCLFPALTLHGICLVMYSTCAMVVWKWISVWCHLPVSYPTLQFYCCHSKLDTSANMLEEIWTSVVRQLSIVVNLFNGID